MKHKLIRYSFIIIIIFLGVRLIGPRILRVYVTTGLGDCRKLPLICMVPEEEIIDPPIDDEFIKELIPYQFPGMKIMLPKGYLVVKEEIKKPYYKKNIWLDKGSSCYLIRERPYFFLTLFPQINRKRVKDDYEFFARMMYAKVGAIENLTDTFFTIIKSIFIPDVGDQNTAKMLKFTSRGMRGFVTYNIRDTGNYFDCNFFSSQGDFFKVYIKDKELTLNLTKLFAILSTAEAK